MLKTLRDSDSAAPASWRTRRRRTALLTAGLAAISGLAAAGGAWALAQQLPAAAPWALAAGGLGLVLAVAVGPRLALPTRPAAALGAALVGLSAASGYVMAAAVPASPTSPARHDPNAQVVARVKRIAEELREGRLSPHAGTPARGELLAFLRAQPDTSKLLDNPFGGPAQATTRLLPAQGSPLPGAAALAAGQEPPALGTKLGPGQPAVPGKPYTLRTFGAIAFDHDPASGEYVLYAIGRAGDQAVLLHQVRGPR